MPTHISKYVRIRDAILADIRSGILKEGDRLPIRDKLIRRYAVTRTTVDKALGGLIREGVLKASKRSGTFVAATQIKLRVAIVSCLQQPQFVGYNSEPNELEAMFSTIILNAKDFNIQFLDGTRISDAMKRINDFDAVVWVQPDKNVMEMLGEFGPKIIITNRYPDFLNFVSTNHRQAIREVTEYYIKHCAKDSQLFYLFPEDNDFVHTERKEGFIEACSGYQRFYRLCPVKINYEETLKSLMRLPIDKQKPVIMISPSCNTTGAALEMARRCKLELGKNFFYSDFDNAHSLNRTGVQVTTILQDYQQMGNSLLNELKNIGKKPIRIFVPYKIVGLL